MSYPPGALKDEYEDASRIGLRNACKDAEAKYDLPPGLMLAVASRETKMKNITGDGGHGRGVFQIDDRWHPNFLRKQGVLGSGGIPPVRESAFYAAALIDSLIKEARSKGVPSDDALRVALAAYNGGMSKVLPAYKAGKDPDSETTGYDYSRDVLQRRQSLLSIMPDGGKSDGKGDGGKSNGKGDGGKSNGKGDGNKISHTPVGPTGGVQAPSGKGGNKIVINPDHLRSMATLLDRSDDDFKEQAHKLSVLKKPAMPLPVAIHVGEVLGGIGVQLRALAPPAHHWAVDLRKRAARVDSPATSGRKGKRTPVKYRHMLRQGSRGAQVRTLQRLLNKFGYGPLEVDGIFGPLTMAAVRKYQAKKHLESDGVVGQGTWAALLGHSVKINRPSVPSTPSAPSTPGGGGGGGAGGEGSGFRKDLLAAARSQIGTTAGFSTGQRNPYTKWAGRMAPTYAEHWCADFVSWAYAKADKPIGPQGKGYSNVDGFIQHFRNNGDWHPRGAAMPPVGAVVCIEWGGGGAADHVGIVSKVVGDTIYYVSGNTGEPGGSHVGVYEKSLPAKFILGYGY